MYPGASRAGEFELVVMNFDEVLFYLCLSTLTMYHMKE